MRFLVAYDIADPRRLRKVARFMEKRAFRCQKSVFLFEAVDAAAVEQLLDDIVPLVDLGQDCVQAWKLSKDEKSDGRARGLGSVIYPAGAVVLAQQIFLVPENHR